ncbi:MAG: potassium transporter Kup [Gemmatimonadetes bacterium]|nr:potassium transporter Kup [Gemmatimonadota bacterium]
MSTPPGGHFPAPRGRYLALLSLGALGVVYGDIGTSPLYALRACFSGRHGLPPTAANVLGVVSLIFWSLAVIISLKYLALVMRADNRGEGGILALMALLRTPTRRRPGARLPAAIVLGLFGAALLYGDGMITPAISVLSAVEGLGVATPLFEPYVVPLTVAILVALFAVQRRGTAGIGAMFGPVTLLWFLAIAALGIPAIAREPRIVAALNPAHAVRFFGENGWAGFVVLGAVFLVVTGGEALYADMGHFGRRPIRLAWFTVVFPSLLLNYFGQGALLLRDASAAEHPFYRLAPGWALYPVVALATGATVIASQAVISGAFSLTRQAVQLGYLPRITIRHTSAVEIGQIYVPSVNWALLLATIGLVLGFGSSSNLAAAYGVAVALTMIITVALAERVMRDIWRWSWPVVAAIAGSLLIVHLAFLGATAIKIPQGGWFPLVVGAAGYVLLSTWRRGREVLGERLSEVAVPLPLLLGDIAAEPPARVAGTAVYLTAQAGNVPCTLMHNLRHNKVLHERLIFLTLVTEEIPRVPRQERVALEDLGENIFRITGRYGFMEEPDVLEVLDLARATGFDLTLEATTFVVGRETLLATKRPGMPIWREKLFAVMSRNTPRITTSFNVPAEQVIEIGAQIEL